MKPHSIKVLRDSKIDEDFKVTSLKIKGQETNSFSLTFLEITVTEVIFDGSSVSCTVLSLISLLY